MERYGHVEREGYPLAAWIWGHRLRIGQHWMEYLLEFLNVLAGFGYELGQGVDGAPRQEYIRFTRLGLRRFVFYDEREKTRHPFDDKARDDLLVALQQQVVTANGDGQAGLDLARSLLRAFSAIEEQRSWFAKSLFPAHHNFLFWEALRKGATKYKEHREAEDTPRQMLDADIAFDARNFFARGGELYYLILSAGTASDPDRRWRIAARLREAAAESFLERCGVCTECLPCPERIDIPELMRLFHLARTFDMGLFARYRYGQMKPNDHWVPGAKATACTGCGECLPRCPQMLDIPALLRKAHDIMQESGTR